MSDEPVRTRFAMQALTLADLFNAIMAEEPVGSYRVELVAPDGPSTGGGKQAVQHIRLTSDHSPVITAGSANPVAKRAELRSYANLQQVHAQRFKGEALALDRIAYNRLLDRMRKFFAQQRMSVVLVDAAVSQPGVPTLADKSSNLGLILSVAAIILLLLGAAFFLFARH